MKPYFALVVLLSPSVAAANGFTCSVFNSGLEKMQVDASVRTSVANLEMAMGFTMGAYFQATGKSPKDWEESGYNQFLQDVIVGCANSTNGTVMDIALDLAASLKKERAAGEISLIDLKLDIEKMAGKSVTVRGDLMVMGGIGMIGSGGFDATPIPVEIDKLPRDQRKALLESCDMQCSVTLTGKVGNVMFQKGLIAESVALD